MVPVEPGGAGQGAGVVRGGVHRPGRGGEAGGGGPRAAPLVCYRAWASEQISEKSLQIHLNVQTTPSRPSLSPPCLRYDVMWVRGSIVYLLVSEPAAVVSSVGGTNYRIHIYSRLPFISGESDNVGFNFPPALSISKSEDGRMKEVAL